MSTSIDPPLVEITPEHAVDVATTATEVVSAKDLEVSAHKKEYSIVGDALFATVSADDAPTWLTDILSTVIGNGLDLALGDLNSARLDLSSALSSMHIAKNEFVEAIDTQADEFGVLVSRIESQNASLNTAVNQVSADISSLQTTAVTPTEASALAADQIAASLNTPGHALHGAVSDVSSVVTSVADLGDSVGGFLDALGTVEENLVISFAQKITEVEAQVGVSLRDYTDANFVNKTSYGQDIATIQAQIDKSITTWFDDGEPTLTSTPAVDWQDDAAKDVHLGDIYYDNMSGYAYRFKKVGSAYSWGKISDQDITAALASAAAAQDTADGKRRVFYATPVSPYDQGDLWDTGNGLKRSGVDVLAGAPFDLAHWLDVADGYGSAADAEQAAKDYADTTFVDNVSYGIDKQQIQEQLDGSITTWFMPGVPLPAETTLPASDWTTTALKDLHIDDLYYDDDTGFVYRYKNVGGTYSWYRIVDQDVIDALDAASNAQDTADSKRRVFFTEGLPQPPYDKGDLWDTGTGLKRAIKDRAAPYTTEGGVVVASPPSTFDWTPIADEYGAASSVYAKTEQTMTSFAALDPAGNPIVSAKFGVNLTTAIDGSVLIGGFDFDNDGTKVTAAFNVDEFKVGRADASGVSPFELIGQEVFIKDAFINTLDLKKLRLDGADVISTVDGVSKIKADYLEVEDVDLSGLLTVTNSVVGETIQSSNFSDAAGSEAGWRLTRDGVLTAQNAVVRGDVEASSIKAGSANIINTLNIAGNAVRVLEYIEFIFPYTVITGSTSWYTVGSTTVNITDAQSPKVLLQLIVRDIQVLGLSNTQEHHAEFRVLRAGVVLASLVPVRTQPGDTRTFHITNDGDVSRSFIDDSPEAGDNTYTLQVRGENVYSMSTTSVLVIDGAKA